MIGWLSVGQAYGYHSLGDVIVTVLLRVSACEFMTIILETWQQAGR